MARRCGSRQVSLRCVVGPRELRRPCRSDHTATKVCRDGRKTRLARRATAPAEISGRSVANDFGPAVGRFVQAHLVQLQVHAVMRVVHIGEDLERDGREIFHGGNAVDHDRLVARQRFEETAHLRVAFEDEERVVPQIDEMLVRERLHVGEIHHHAAIGRAFRLDGIALQGDFEHVAMAVQVTALAAVVGDAVARVEFEFSGDRQHGASGANSGNVQVLVRLHREAPLRMTLAPVDGELRVQVARRTIHRLDEKILEVELRVVGQTLVVLRHHDLEFVAFGDHERRVGLRAHADPVDGVEHRQRAVGFDGDLEARRVQCIDERRVDLQHGLAARADHEAVVLALGPQRRDLRDQLFGRAELAAVLTVGADEVGVAKTALRRLAIFLAARPQIAAGEPAEHGRTPGVRAFALQRVENFLYRVSHAAA
ncbi:hypothetical protein PT2222_10163 [Paraburkholderia tropica]